MQITIGVEQAIYVIAVLARQNDNQPLKSHVLSKILDVSDSYLRKIIRKLVIAKIVKSSASKTGGISLNMDTNKITFLDIFEAVGGNSSFLKLNNLGEKVIMNSVENFNNNSDKVVCVFNEAENEYKKVLSRFTIADLLAYEFENLPSIDWNLIVK
ncbi:RrF2 family transcriptional regulator [Clostridium akagii]|uniref:RrF2 family transcriptional regulator n=1 Tax=Clostridium akagii TaxID=91623 RepID=UPI00047E3B4C|nr:Rrf2 family transcriptional regulator [Clostridium akagii]